MQRLAVLFLFCIISLKCFSQDENIIKFKSEVTFILSKSENGNFTYKITEIKKFNKTVDLSNNDLFKNKIDTDQVKLFFCTGMFGDSEQTILMIKSGLKTPIAYTAKIRKEDEHYFESTSVNPLFPNVKSIEQWPYKINSIILSDFSILKY